MVGRGQLEGKRGRKKTNEDARPSCQEEKGAGGGEKRYIQVESPRDGATDPILGLYTILFFSFLLLLIARVKPQKVREALSPALLSFGLRSALPPPPPLFAGCQTADLGVSGNNGGIYDLFPPFSPPSFPPPSDAFRVAAVAPSVDSSSASFPCNLALDPPSLSPWLPPRR